jgi:serine/threonine protein kinase
MSYSSGSIVVGKYTVLRTLGEGASGEVYLVQHKDLGVRLALKILHVEASSNQSLVDGFKREAELLFKFSHQGCVQLRDFGRLEDGRYFMATDFCEGGTLRDLLLRTSRLDIGYALQIISQILDVADAAHDTGIIHRDIKPENIMILRSPKGEDQVKVLDFGVAQLLALSSSQPDSPVSAGTPEYMSPEQALGSETIDGRADIYSIGVVAYELVQGSVPFSGEDDVQTLIKHVTQAPLGFQPFLKVPKLAEKIILKALAKDPLERHQTAGEFSQSIREFLATSTKSSTNIKNQASSTQNIAKATLQEDENQILRSTTNTSEVEETSKTKILLLDDDSNMLSILSHILEHAGYKVFTASHPSNIHNILFGESVELFITDVQMPALPGTKVCQLIKKSLPNLKVLLFSNIPERDLAKLVKESSANGYVSKNSSPQEWLYSIESTIKSN